MKLEDAEVLKNLVGKTVVEIRVSDDEEDYGFELVFDDGTTLEVYDLRCMAMSEKCKGKRIQVANFETGEAKDVVVPFVGGGVVWTVGRDAED